MSEQFYLQHLDDLQRQGLRRYLRSVEGRQGAHITVDGRQVINFCSNNYLGLADDLRLKTAAIDALDREGVGSGASRLVCGNMKAHRTLEKRIAAFKRKEAALAFSTGYMANVGIISSLFDRHDVIFADKLNHASIIDGIKLSGAKCKRYRHTDMESLRYLLETTSGHCQKRVIITDSVFSMDGDIAPLDEIVALARQHQCWVMIDEAHAFGVMGANGRGAAEHFGVEDEIDIVMGTFSKAAGSFGAYCCGSQDLIDYLTNKARSFIYTTGMPPSVAAASSAAIDIIASGAQLRAHLWDLARLVRDELRQAGFDTGQSQTPIIPVLVGDGRAARDFSHRLLEAGVFIGAILPPTVPPNTARLRLSLTAEHTLDDCYVLIDKCKKIGAELCLI
jgi:8-amino-7-oxononanoate synthase